MSALSDIEIVTVIEHRRYRVDLKCVRSLRKNEIKIGHYLRIVFDIVYVLRNLYAKLREYLINLGTLM